VENSLYLTFSHLTFYKMILNGMIYSKEQEIVLLLKLLCFFNLEGFKGPVC
jgi:hypothetical protein